MSVRSAAATLGLLAGLLICAPVLAQGVLQTYQIPIDVEAGTSDRFDKPVDAALDLTAFLAGIPGTLDVATLQVVEVDGFGTMVDDAVLFQFDQDPGFDPTTNAAGNLVFIMDGATTAGTTRYYQLAFDLVGACPTCPAPPIVPSAITVNSITYEGQLTYEVVTPQATYMYHSQGGGLASLFDQDAQDWVSFHDIAGSKSAGEWRGIPNLVYVENDAANSFFHPGFTNATSQVVNAGPLKVTVRSQGGPPTDLWDVLWEFYPEYARMTVLGAGTGNADPYWCLYEGTIGGSMDAGDVVVRSGGTSTSAYEYGSSWEEDLPSSEWAYFRDTTAPRALFFSNDQGDSSLDSYFPLGQSTGSTPEMSVFGFGRVLETSPNGLEGRLTGVNRSFTMGFVEDHTLADGEIAAASKPLTVVVNGATGTDADPVSDDFSAFSLDNGLWTFVDPVGDSSVRQAYGVVTLSLPGDSAHDAWTGANTSARIMQSVAGTTDIGLEAKFESLPSAAFQTQGILLEETPGNYIRVDFYSDGTDLHLFGASFLSDTPTVEDDVVISATGDIWLEITRAVDTFTVQWSDDGSTWNTGISFDHTMVLNEVGVFAGNTGSPVPAFDAVVDYFFNTSSPIVPEDDGLVDIWPPVISNITVTPDPSGLTALITCTTDESATTLLSFGTDTGYGTDVVGTTSDGLNHEFALTGLTPDELYHFVIRAEDSLTNFDITPDQQFLNEVQKPTVTIWGGPSQKVGHLGPAQADFNLMGNIERWSTLSTLGYSLNGAPEQPLNWGNREDGFGDGKRLAANGDFNLDLPLTQLLASNTIAIHAVDLLGNEDTVIVDVEKVASGSSDFPYNVAWTGVTDPQEVGQYVDGEWALDGSGTGLRTMSVGYDRIFLFGEESWTDYEITTSVTVNAVQNPTGPVSGAPGLGFMTRFTGHVVGGHRNWPAAQPKWGYQPFGGIGWLRYYSETDPTVQFYHGDYDVAENFGVAKDADSTFQLDRPESTFFGDRAMATDFGAFNKFKVGETFFMKMRCETLPDAPNGDGVTRYSYKVWLSTDTEPVDWNFQVDQQSEFALRQGSAALLAHHIDATFGDVTVADLSAPSAPTAYDDALSVVTGLSGMVDILANDSDTDGLLDPTSVTIVDPPDFANTFSVDPVTGVVTYEHDGGVEVVDSFTYTVDDDEALTSNIATVLITIGPPTPPTAADDAIFAVTGSIAYANVLANDLPGNAAIDPTTVTIVDPPNFAANPLIVDPVTGVVTYEHDGGVEAADSFTYTVDDINGSPSNTATVVVTIGEIPEGDFLTDDFNNCLLNPIWTFVDPQGDASPPVILGAFSGDAQVAISVPGATSHELFDGVIGAPYIIQSTSDSDFTVEVKFDSALPATDFAEQGIIVRQDDTNWLRLEFYSRGTDQVYVLAGLPNNLGFPNNELIPGLTAGASPLYMRVARAGDTWTQSYSTDGTSWTDLPSFNHPLNVTGVGLYAGNAGSNPSHTVLVDYFANSLAPIIPPDDTGLNTNTLTTSAVGNGNILLDLDKVAYACGDLEELTAVPDPGWAFDSWSGDLTGNTNPVIVPMNGPMVVTATFVPAADEAPVAIDDVLAVQVGASGNVDVVFNDTDVNGDLDPTTVAILNPPVNGTITNVDAVTGVVTYAHDGSGNLSDTFTYTVQDLLGATSNAATVTVTIGDIPPGMFVSDDFNACLVKPIWTFVNGPLDDSADPVILGAFTGDAQVAIDVPGGSSHELYNGVISAPHIIQSTTDDDFTLEVKFDSVMPAVSHAMQGIIVQESASEWLRFEFFTQTPDEIAVLAGLPDIPQTYPVFLALGQPAGSSPMYMRVQRAGDTWTQSYSYDGTAWTVAGSFDYTLDVSLGGVGVYGGNAVSRPAHTVLVDYFSNSLDAVPVPDDQGQNTLTTAVVGNGSITVNPDLATYTCGQLVTLTPDPDSGWVFDSWSGDLTGNDNPATIAMNDAMDITATFVESGPPIAPVANDDILTVLEGAGGDVDVLDNDTDANNDIDPSTVTITGAGPANGTITNIDLVTGIVTYTHDGSANLTDSFTYTVDDLGGLTSNEATVNVTIEPLVPPTAVDDASSVLISSTVDTDVLANDLPGNAAIDPGTVAIVNPPTYGTITNIDLVTGVVTYLHGGGVELSDSYTYTVDDVNGTTSNIATVQMTITDLPPGMFVSDDFNYCLVKPIWQFVNPFGDAADPVILGAFSGDAQVAIDVPGGVAHELINGSINVPHIIQSTTDDDFTLEVKFDSVLLQENYAEQGIIVKESASEWLRFEFFSQLTPTNEIGVLAGLPDVPQTYPIFVPGLPASTSPLYMRVQRAGDTWTQSYSFDGAAWTVAGSFDYTLDVSLGGVGVYGGNADGNPAHTVLVDYFSNSLAPVPDPEDQDQNTLTTAVVGLGSIIVDPDLVTYPCSESVELTPDPVSGWAFDSWSGDLTGNANPATVIMDGPLSVTATFVEIIGNTVAANTSGVLGLSTVNTCEAGVPVEIVREGLIDMRGYTVTVALNNLDLCNGVASIFEGDYLSSVNPTTTFQVTDNLDGTYEIQGDIVGAPCGASALSGTLFTLDVSNTIPDGTGTISVTSVEVRDCGDVPLPSSAGAPADIVIDTTIPVGVTALGSSKVLSSNPAGNVTAIDLSWTPSGDPTATGVQLFRKGYGFYPEYSDDGGAAPALPTDPVAEGWETVTTVLVGANTFSDLATNRDFWYFCARTVDAVGNPSPAIMTAGVTNYILGDVADNSDPIEDGDNKVWTEDLTLLGSHYGTSHGEGLYLNTLDIGPTSDTTINGLPTTDNEIQFEDLILLGINYTLDVSGQLAKPVFTDVPAPAPNNIMAVHLPDLPEVGQTFEAELVMAGDGQVQGLRIPLGWDEAVVKPVAVSRGDLMSAQGGRSLVLSAEPGVVDICLAGVRETGISGVGTVATVTFEVLASGEPSIRLAEIDARDQTNHQVGVATGETSDVGDGETLPTVSVLHPNYPNPFNPVTTIAFDLAASGRVRIDIFSIDGRRVRTLIDESMAAGRHSAVWDGRDNSGRTSASGTYLYVMEGPGIRQTRRMLLVK